MKRYIAYRFIAFQLFSFLAYATSHAVGIGEPSLISSLGEPLYAKVELRLAEGEQIDEGCLSLAPADDTLVSGMDYTFLRTLTVKYASKNTIEIRSKKPFHEPYAIFRLRINCAGQGVISKTITLLPELGNDQTAHTVSTAPIDPVHPAEPPSAPVVAKEAIVSPKMIETKLEPEAIATEKPIIQPASIASNKREKRKHHVTQFHLKLSGATLDLSRLGKLSEEDKEVLQLQQKWLDEDDQTAKYLAMQHQLKLMQEELTEIRLKLAQISSGTQPASAATRTISVTTVSSSTSQWRNGIIVGGLVAAVVLLAIYLRSFTRRKELVIEEPSPVNIPSTEHFIISPAAPTPPSVEALEKTPLIIPPVEQEKPQAPIANPAKELEDSVLEEAELYAIYGHPDKAVKMLKEYVAQHQHSENVWLLLLSIYSSCGQATEFENTARAFQRHNRDSDLWKTVQALGRTLDKDHTLYADATTQTETAPWLPYLSKHKHRPLGDILVELGYLSPEDMRNCLQDFDPKFHGRFGNYLLTKRLVSHAQLNEALLIQQGGSDTPLPAEGLPSLQQVENLLSGFDPEKDGSVEDYLMAHQVDVVERLKNTQSEDFTAVGEDTIRLKPEMPSPDKLSPLDFVLDLDLPLPETTKQVATPPKVSAITIDFEPRATPEDKHR